MSKPSIAPQPGKQAVAAQMNVDVMIYGGSAGCVDKHTEVLTRKGWKFISNLEGNESVLSYNADTGNFNYEVPTEYITEPEEDLYQIKGKGLDMVLSSEHHLIYWNDRGQTYNSQLWEMAESLNKTPENFRFKDRLGNVYFAESVTYYPSEDGYKYCVSVRTGYFLARRNGCEFITGNSGKSRLLLNKAGYYAHTDPNFEGVMFRRTTKPLSAAGGLFSEAKKLYRQLGIDVREQAMEIDFYGVGGSKNDKKGGNLKFTHLEHEKDAEGNHQGLQYSFVGFDELTHFTQGQFLYLIGRMRSEADSDSFCLATTNPDYNSWVYNWVSWYLKDGIFDEDKLGVIRYFLIVDDAPVFANTEEELAEAYPDMCYIYNPVEDKEEYVPPMTFCFIGGTIFDNPALIRQNPKYLSALKAQTEINRRRLLDGDWHAVPEGSQYFERKWLNKLEKRPEGCVAVRAWDTASEEPSDKNRQPDWTASVKMLKNKEGDIIIVGDYEEDSFDEKLQSYGRYRLRSGARDRAILRQHQYDGLRDCTMILAVDPASAGKFQYREQSKNFSAEGILVKPDPMPNNKSKLLKFEPFSTACANGLVYIVESSFPNKQTLENFYKELEQFDGERSTGSKKDDWADAAASAYNFLVSKKIRGRFSGSGLSSGSSKLSAHKSRIQ